MKDSFRVLEIREILRKFVTYRKDELLREELNTIANNNYIQKYSDTDYIDFICRHQDKFSIEIIGSQSTNFPYYLSMFTCVTQHIKADNIRQLLDKAIEIELNQTI